MERAVTVSQLNQYIKTLLDADARLQAVLVRGEISNFKQYPSGHCYFTLKDQAATLKCVLFRSHAGRLRFAPQSGMRVVASGAVSVFERDGVYQLYVRDLLPEGVGELHLAFEQLKKKLHAEGLFDEQYKKPLPPFPQRIGVVTSKAGAVFHDIVNVLSRRYPLATVVLFPVAVQGAPAPGEIAAAIAEANRRGDTDVLIVGRGGGSLEELWAFNDERVARAIFASAIPIVSAVGHETDVSIADYVADRRAPTPSAAAEIVSPDAARLADAVAGSAAALRVLVRAKLQDDMENLQRLSAKPCMADAVYTIIEKKEALHALRERLENGVYSTTDGKSGALSHAAALLDAFSPFKILARGYAIAQKDGEALTDAGRLAVGETVRILLNQGAFDARVQRIETGAGQRGQGSRAGLAGKGGVPDGGEKDV